MSTDGYFGGYFGDYFGGYFGPQGAADPNAMRGTAAGVASVSGTLTGATAGAFALQAETGVISLTGIDISFKAPNRIGGTVRKRRRRGQAWNYDRAFAKRQAERFESETFPIPPKPAPKPQAFVSLLETYRPTVTATAKTTRPHWRIEDYQAALEEKRRQQAILAELSELDDEEVLLLLEAA